jgi:hypothetical protein
MALAAAFSGLGDGIILRVFPRALAAESLVKTFELVVRDRKLVGRKNVIRVTEGDTVTLRWRLDGAAEIHVHGYNLKVAAKPGVPAVLTFKAATAGRFSVSAHWAGGHSANQGRSRHSESRILYLEVYPR